MAIRPPGAVVEHEFSSDAVDDSEFESWHWFVGFRAYTVDVSGPEFGVVRYPFSLVEHGLDLFTVDDHSLEAGVLDVLAIVQVVVSPVTVVVEDFSFDAVDSAIRKI